MYGLKRNVLNFNCMCNDAIKTILIDLSAALCDTSCGFGYCSGPNQCSCYREYSGDDCSTRNLQSVFTSIKHTVKPLEFVMFNFCLIHVYFLSTKLQSEQIRNKILTCFYNKNK